MPNDLYLLVSTAFAAIPKEAYLLIGTALGAFVTLVTGVINTRAQLKLARANHEHQYRLETQKLEYQQQAEMQKLAHQEQKERTAWLREKLEEAIQIVLKIAMLNSMTGSSITRETGISEVEWNAHYLKLDEEASRLQTMADLYFPDLRRPMGELRGAMNVFWGAQRHLLYVDTEQFLIEKHEHIADDASFKDQAEMSAMRDVVKITHEIGEKVGNVRYELMQIARALREPD